jgi:FkbM family methyltransferase
MKGNSPVKSLRLYIAQKVCKRFPPLFSQRLRTFIYPIQNAVRDDYEFVVRSQTGSLLKHTTSDYHGYTFCVHGFFEWRNWAIALALVSAGDTVIEIGANIGTETVGFSDIVGRSGRVYAIEPEPSCLKSLKDNLEINHCHNVSLLPLAIGEYCKQVRFILPPNKHCSGIGYVSEQAEELNSNSIEVHCVTLDSLSSQIDAVRIIFIDAEGSEMNILKGGRKLISRDKPHIVLEASPKLLLRAGSSIFELLTEISNLDYVAHRIGRVRLKRILSSNKIQKSNWLCVHESMRDIPRLANKYLMLCGLLPCVAGINPLTRKKNET